MLLCLSSLGHIPKLKTFHINITCFCEAIQHDVRKYNAIFINMSGNAVLSTVSVWWVIHCLAVAAAKKSLSIFLLVINGARMSQDDRCQVCCLGDTCQVLSQALKVQTQVLDALWVVNGPHNDHPGVQTDRGISVFNSYQIGIFPKNCIHV